MQVYFELIISLCVYVSISRFLSVSASLCLCLSVSLSASIKKRKKKKKKIYTIDKLLSMHNKSLNKK